MDLKQVSGLIITAIAANNVLMRKYIEQEVKRRGVDKAVVVAELDDEIKAEADKLRNQIITSLGY